jgi:PAS domain S-box-containing protein
METGPRRDDDEGLMDAERSRPARRQGLVVVGVAAIAAVAAILAMPTTTHERVLASTGLVTVSSLVGWFVIARAVRSRAAVPSAIHFATGLVFVAVGTATMFFAEWQAPGRIGPGPLDTLFLLPLVPFARAAHAAYRAHVDRHDLGEFEADVLLLAASITAALYLALHPSGADGDASLSATVFAVVAASLISFFAFLALWAPRPVHLGLFAVAGAVSLGVATFAYTWVRGTYDASSLVVHLTLALGPLAFAALVANGWRPDRAAAPKSVRVAHPVMSNVSVLTACGALALAATYEGGSTGNGPQTPVIIAILCVAIAARIIANQLAATSAHAEVSTALAEREEALRETDVALERARRAHQTLLDSEEHLRLVFDAAVDGIVELSSEGMIVRANEAFCTMVGLPRSSVEGQSWSTVAASLDGHDGTLSSLPTNGEAQFRGREGQVVHLEARTSQMPTDPPRRLLMIRDVTAARVSEETIRSLLQFLQDRDEDRTRLMRRTNSAIESERNRIARDLHDGPVQGVSAASLSLEAALLMLSTGDVERGTEVLRKIRQELAEEADALRRLMSGLRPPVLEERGLIPALREMLTRFEAEQGIRTTLSGSITQEVNDDVETLAYRVVQEAITNVGKHARAGETRVHVTTDPTQLTIEVDDDGRGFETSHGREFLRAGRVGLASMRERVELASGTMTVRSSPGHGTTITAVLPIDASLVAREQASGATSEAAIG